MQDQKNPLVKHLLLAVLFKLVVLALLWWFFIRDVIAPAAR